MTRRNRAILAGLILLATPQAALSEDAWSFKVIPYVWTPAMSGDVAAIPGTPTVEVDLSSIDVLKNIDFAGFVVGEARHGDLFFRGELMYASLSASENSPGPIFSDAEVTSKTFMSTLAVGYTVKRGPDYQDRRVRRGPALVAR